MVSFLTTVAMEIVSKVIHVLAHSNQSMATITLVLLSNQMEGIGFDILIQPIKFIFSRCLKLSLIYLLASR